MDSKIKKYVDNLFEEVPKTRKTYEIKSELISSISSKYNDLLDSGLNEEEAYLKAIENGVNINNIIKENEKDLKESEEYRKKYSKLYSIGIMLYILCPTPVILLGDRGFPQDRIGVILLLAMVAIATSILIYNGYNKPTTSMIDDELYAEFINWKKLSDKDRILERRIKSILNSLILLIYLIVSFTYNNWEISWIIFIIGGIVRNIIIECFEYKNN